VEHPNDKSETQSNEAVQNANISDSHFHSFDRYFDLNELLCFQVIHLISSFPGNA